MAGSYSDHLESRIVDSTDIDYYAAVATNVPGSASPVACTAMRSPRAPDCWR